MAAKTLTSAECLFTQVNYYTSRRQQPTNNKQNQNQRERYGCRSDYAEPRVTGVNGPNTRKWAGQSPYGNRWKTPQARDSVAAERIIQ
jgi:hypothetical protein